MFELKNVSKSFGTKQILKDLDYKFQGEKVAFVGLNGVGKSTTMRIILGMDKKIQGEVNVANKADVSVQFSDNALPEYLTIKEFCEMKKIDSQKYENLVELLNVREHENKMIKELSLGTKMKMNLIYALGSESEMVFLDEPTNGLDYNTVYNLIEFVKNDNRKYFIISHDLHFIEGVCDQLVILNNYKIEFNQPTKDIDIKEQLNDIIEKNRASN